MRVQRLVHGVENFDARLLGLSQSLAHHGNTDARHLDVHLQSGNAFASARHLEIHIAVMVLSSRDIRQNGVVPIADHQAHRDARARRLHRHTGVHQGE